MAFTFHDLNSDSSFFAEIMRIALREGSACLVHNVNWIRHHQDAQAIKSAVIARWRKSIAPLSQWADSIHSVQVYTDDDECGLRIDFGDVYPSIFQFAPFESDDLQNLRASFVGDTPSQLERLACSAPGLTFDRRTRLLDVTAIQSPLESILNWLQWEDNQSQVEVLRELQKKCSIELLTTELGDIYCLARDMTVLFFDHEELTLTPCDLGLVDFIHAFVLQESSFIEPTESCAFIGPAVQLCRNEVAPSLLSQIFSIQDGLSGIYQLALSVKHWGRLSEWISDDLVLHDSSQLLSQARAFQGQMIHVCSTGTPIATRFGADLISTLESCTATATDEVDKYKINQFAEFTRRLIMAGMNPSLRELTACEDFFAPGVLLPLDESERFLSIAVSDGIKLGKLKKSCESEVVPLQFFDTNMTAL
jgi:hypothetical protein